MLFTHKLSLLLVVISVVKWVVKEFITGRVSNSSMVSTPAIWIGCRRQSAVSMLSCEKHSCKEAGIFTADCLQHSIQMMGIETIWELHTLPVINSWWSKILRAAV